jgi:stress response protein YsnF
MDMVYIARELKENADRTMELCKRKLGEEVFDNDDIDTELVELMRGVFRICDLATQLTCEQANAMNEINRKLDKLLETK